MSAHNLADIPPPPEPPEDYECCNNGCDELCVFEIYKLQKADYDARYARLVNSIRGITQKQKTNH